MGKLIAALSAIAEAVAGIARFLTNKQLINAGRAAERADRAEEALETKDAQLKEAAAAPRHHRELADRLRRGERF